MGLGTDGLRGELTLIRAARALAAYDGDAEVADRHLKAIAPSALRHRLRRNPLDDAFYHARRARRRGDIRVSRLASAEPEFSADAVLAAAVVAIDPHGTGIVLRARPGPVREAWLALLKSLLPDGVPVRRIPLNIADDRLLGGLDLAATLSAGYPVAARGLLAEADAGSSFCPVLSASPRARLRASPPRWIRAA